MPQQVLAVGDKLPDWAKAGIAFYNQRLPTTWQLTFVHLPAQVSPEADWQQLERYLQGKPWWMVALVIEGKSFDSLAFAQEVMRWREEHHYLAFLIGGATGLPTAAKQRAQVCWSLSPLTFPHALAQLLLAEQWYRAYTVAQKHPYHK